MKKTAAINELLEVMARLRAPDGCPWDREQDHRSIRFHAVEEAYELLDAIEAKDDHEIAEELGDLLLQVVFHCQMAEERGLFNFDQVARHLVDKLIRRHPHVFGESKVKSIAGIWDQWEQIKKSEKHGTRHERPSTLDGVPKHLPALFYAEKLVRKARKTGLAGDAMTGFLKPQARDISKSALSKELFALAACAQEKGWSAEALLRSEIKKTERAWRRQESKANRSLKEQGCAK